MKILIIGANGQLGTDLVKVWEMGIRKWKMGNRREDSQTPDTRHQTPVTSHQVVALTHRDIEICDHEGTRKILESHRPNVVINTAAYHRVDECEENPERAFAVNAIAVRNLAGICRDLDCVLVHISTDYVFDGKKGRPYTEEDLPNPLNVYGVSKLAGEYFVRNLCPKHYITRTASLFGVAGASGKGGNFVETMIRKAKAGEPIKVVEDVVMSPTYTRDLAGKIFELAGTDTPYGVYHLTNGGECSWYGFAEAIFKMAGLEPDLERTTIEEMGVRAERPRYSALESRNLKGVRIEWMKDWREALKEYLVEKGHVGGE